MPQQCIEAVDYCHRRDVAHRDLKLDNTLLDESKPPFIKICDFGFAKLMGNNNLLTSIGTPVYMAPQQIQKGRKGYDGRAAGEIDVSLSRHAVYGLLR
jgi:serine/threonine-protein kinase SRK2